jgi:uncharacterized protein (DUF1499 family)
VKTLALILTIILVGGCASKPSNSSNGELAPCPVFPGCASTTWVTSGSQEDVWAAIIAYVTTERSMTIVEQTGTYLHVEARTPTMNFVDDLQFRLSGNGTIAARSSSRLGISDLGANRARLTRIGKAIPQINQDSR